MDTLQKQTAHQTDVLQEEAVYRVQGMHCAACVERVQSALAGIDGVKSARVTLTPAEARIHAGSTLSIEALNNIIRQKAGTSYSLADTSATHDTPDPQASPILGFERLVPAKIQSAPLSSEVQKTWFQTYKPLLLIVAYILAGTAVFVSVKGHSFTPFPTMCALNGFMGLFFVTFSFFKMLDVPAFARSYAMYDVVAKRWQGWGYIYPFVELVLGIACLLEFQPFATNLAVLVVMSVSIVGVVQSRLQRRQIQCACLGTVFHLPMSSVTIIEDGVMIAMSLVMLALL